MSTKTLSAPKSSTEEKAKEREGRRPPKRQPPYNVILMNDDDHTFDYVIRMLAQIFGHPVEKGFRMAEEVNNTGRVIVDTTTLERAELKRDQIHAFGADPEVPHCKGSMSARLEPAE